MIRVAKKEDAAKIIEVLKQCYGETTFLNCGPGEFNISLEKEENWIEKKNNDPMSRFYVIVDDGEIVGTLGLDQTSSRNRLKHNASMGIAIVKKAWHKGLGCEAMKKVIEDATNLGYENLTLSVYANNTRAIKLYQSYGFEEYGRLKNYSKLSDGTYQDDVLMVKYL